MSKKRETVFIGIGILAGLALGGPAAQAADYLTARPSSQTFYINGQQTALTAYAIGGSNYVRLRDIGKAVDFGVTYDAATNGVHIDSAQPYRKETSAQAGPRYAQTPHLAISHGGELTTQVGIRSAPAI